VSQFALAETDMSMEERAELILAFAKALYVNGQSTDQTLLLAAQFGHTLGVRAMVVPPGENSSLKLRLVVLPSS
jgi:hypothetical protein